MTTTLTRAAARAVHATKSYGEGESRVYFHEGNFESYEENKRQRLGHDADQPHRLKYKKLTH